MLNAMALFTKDVVMRALLAASDSSHVCVRRQLAGTDIMSPHHELLGVCRSGVRLLLQLGGSGSVQFIHGVPVC